MQQKVPNLQVHSWEVFLNHFFPTQYFDVRQWLAPRGGPTCHVPEKLC